MSALSPTPCPFCGSIGIGTVMRAGSWAAACSDCGALGPVASNPDQAMTFWSRRSRYAAGVTAPAVEARGRIHVEAKMTKRSRTPT